MAGIKRIVAATSNEDGDGGAVGGGIGAAGAGGGDGAGGGAAAGWVVSAAGAGAHSGTDGWFWLGVFSGPRPESVISIGAYQSTFRTNASPQGRLRKLWHFDDIQPIIGPTTHRFG